MTSCVVFGDEIIIFDGGGVYTPPIDGYPYLRGAVVSRMLDEEMIEALK